MFLLTGMPFTVMSSNTADHNPGKYIEAYSRSRTRDAITSLAKLKPIEALVVALADKKHPVACFGSEDEDLEMGKTDIETEKQIFESGFKVQKVPVDLLEIGDVVRVPSGSTPPRDGIVASGQSLFDESLVTGESKPIKKETGDNVFLGTINIGQAIDVTINVAEGETMSVSLFFPKDDFLTFMQA